MIALWSFTRKKTPNQLPARRHWCTAHRENMECKWSESAADWLQDLKNKQQRMTFFYNKICTLFIQLVPAERTSQQWRDCSFLWQFFAALLSRQLKRPNCNTPAPPNPSRINQTLVWPVRHRVWTIVNFWAIFRSFEMTNCAMIDETIAYCEAARQAINQCLQWRCIQFFNLCL